MTCDIINHSVPIPTANPVWYNAYTECVTRMGSEQHMTTLIHSLSLSYRTDGLSL